MVYIIYDIHNIWYTQCMVKMIYDTWIFIYIYIYMYISDIRNIWSTYDNAFVSSIFRYIYIYTSDLHSMWFTYIQ